jgi:hypothetical protein
MNDADTDELREAHRRIVATHHIDVPQLLWAAQEIERLRKALAEQTDSARRWQNRAHNARKRRQP